MKNMGTRVERVPTNARGDGFPNRGTKAPLKTVALQTLRDCQAGPGPRASVWTAVVEHRFPAANLGAQEVIGMAASGV